MAEYVHQTLEEMLPELEEMTRSEVFSPQETKTILKKREAFEYRLRQKTKTKISYLNYIEYEEKLLELIKLRKKQNGLDQGKRVIENCIMERISSLHRLLTTRFPEDIALWERHIKFCVDTNQLSYVTRIYSKMLRIHSHREDIWVKAAQFERSPEGNGNPELARELLLKAQRVLPNSETIFLEMYQMELDLATTVLKRKKVLNIIENDEMEDDGENRDFAEFKLAQIVANKALEIFPANPQFHLKMLNVCSKFKMAANQFEEMVSQLKETYPTYPNVWNGLAMCQLNKYRKLTEAKKKLAADQCLSTLKEGLERVASESMWNLCLQGHLDVLHLRHGNNDADQILSSTLELFQKAISLDMLSVDLYQKLISMLNDMGLTEDAGQVAERAIQSYPSCSKLWLVRLENMAERGVSLDDIVKEFNVASRKVDQASSWPLWELVLHLAADLGHPSLEPLMEEACRTVSSQVCRPAKEWCLEWTYRTGGVKNARKVFKTLKCMRPITLEFYRRYIVIEASQLEPNVDLMRCAFEEALSEFGNSNQDIWLNYMEMERKMAQDPAKVGLLHQRAIQSLVPELKENFMRTNTMLGLAA